MRFVFMFFALCVLSVSATEDETKKVTQTVCWNECGRPQVAELCKDKERYDRCKAKCPTLPLPCEKARQKALQNENNQPQPSSVALPPKNGRDE